MKHRIILAVILASICTTAAARRVTHRGNGPPAAVATANSVTNDCNAVPEFYWEIGDATGMKAAGSKGATYTQSSLLSIASASKWIYGAYVAQSKTLDATDIKFLTMTGGYNSFGWCSPLQTVQACHEDPSPSVGPDPNDLYTAANDGKFFYAGGDFQHHGVTVMGIGALTKTTLATAVSTALGVTVEYDHTMLAGGARMTPANYAIFLRKILNGDLSISALLGSSAVCTNPATCTTAVSTPTPFGVSWDYSIGHWIETDGTRSNVGGYGFYAWINPTKNLYGMVVREEIVGSGFDSAACGRLIRNAWTSGIAQ
jgi:hypothetical protein